MAWQRRRLNRPQAEALESREAPAVSLNESFDTVSPGQLPAGWAQWDSTPAASFTVSAGQSLSPPNSLLGSATTSSAAARAWYAGAQATDVQVGAAVYLNSLFPAQVLARGTALDTTTPSYYALSITRGLQLQLLRVQNGVPAVLGQLQSAGYLSGVWVRLTLSVSGSTLRGQVFRPDKGQYLTPSGQWQSGVVWALNVTDTALAGPGDVGVARGSGYVGGVSFDDFVAAAATGDSVPPSVTLTAPAAGAALTGVVPVQVAATDNVGVTRVEFYVDNVLRAASTAAPYVWDFNTASVANGTHTVSAWAYDAAGNVGQTSLTVSTQNDTTLPRPVIPQHNPDIRVAELAYVGTPLDATTTQLLQNNADLVVSAAGLLGSIHALAPNTPQLIYTNFSNLYQDLLPDWLTYADAHGLPRESAFYHVAAATPFSGSSPSSQPVNWFWSVYRGTDPSWTLQTSQARGTAAGGLTFAAAGQSVVFGYPDEFREINVKLTTPAAGGWSAVLEYPTAVDANGNPTAWATLTPLSDGTAGLTQSGRITFDPPPGWVPASIAGSARLYYVRFRTTSGGTAPVAATVLGRDYVNANGGTSGTIPAFDYAADTNHDGYLNDAEYAAAAAGDTARFAYEGRLFAPSYGQMRFAVNPSNLGVQAWAVDYATRLLASQPLAAGLFVDNSGANAPAAAGSVLEPVAPFGIDYAALLNAVGRAVAPHWLLANVSGTGTVADPVVRSVQGAYEEFALRPLSGNYQQFENLAGLVAHQETLTSPPPYLVLDSLPAGGSPTDARTQLATLAEYYLLADPNNTFLDFYGGSAPATSWSQHWTPAAAYDVGKPTASWSVAATGADPANPALTYRVYERPYTNALVLYKPLSYAAAGSVTGTTADATATTINLGATYYPVLADGTLGAAVTSVSLRNGEGIILAKGQTVAGTLVLAGLPASTTAGQSVTITVTADAADGTVNPGYTSTVHFSSTDGQAVLPADYTFTAADRGTHSFYVTFKTTGSQTLTVTDGAGDSPGSAATAVGPGLLRGFGVQLSATTATAGSTVTATVTALDAYGNTVTGYAGTVRFRGTDLLETLPAAYTFTAGDAGVHAFAATFRTAGTQTLTAYDSVTAGSLGSAALTVTPDAADHFALAGPAGTTAGVAVGVTVTALDAFNNVVTGYGGTVHVASSDATATLPADYTFQAGDGGKHTFAAVTLRTAGTQTVTATAGAVAGTLSLGVSPAAVAGLRVLVPPGITAGAAFNVTVQAVDPFGNVVLGYTGTVGLTSGDPQALLPAAYTFTATDRGSHVFRLTLKTAGGQTLTATDTGNAALAGTVAVPVSPGPVRGFAVQFTAAATAGTALAVTVTALDGSGNVVPGYTGTVRFRGTDPLETLPAAYTFTAADAGVHTFAVTFRTAGTQTLTAYDSVTTGFLGSASVPVAPAAASVLVVSGFPTSITTGTAGSFTVTARDPYGNIATGYAGTVHFTSSDAQALLPADYAFQPGDRGAHIFSAVFETAGAQKLTAADVLTGTVTGSQVGIVVSRQAGS
jgi:hypothetical protein